MNVGTVRAPVAVLVAPARVFDDDPVNEGTVRVPDATEVEPASV